MNHWIIAPIILPAIMAPILLMGARYDMVLARVFSMVSAVCLLGISLALTAMVSDGTILTYALGNWVPPFGIVLVADRLSVLMLVLTAVLALVVLLFAFDGSDQEGRHFHALYQFQLMGINGAFLTGDFFNLFVFFEILLIASYGLMVHGGGAARMKAGVQYVAINLVGSALFLISVGMIYAVAGTLNMADLALKVPQIAAADQALLHAGALLLLLVFCVKAALVPVHFWLPGTYANTSAAVAALFAIMTKVGAYCVIRFYLLAFGEQAGPSAGLAWPWLLPAALLTLVLGGLGVLAARRLGQLASFAVIASMGLLLTAVSASTPLALSAALYYSLHATLAGAVLFLIAEQVARRRPGHEDALSVAPCFGQRTLLAAAFFVAAIAATGMPPLSGFIGKLMILEGFRSSDYALIVWVLILASSLLVMIGFARAGSTLFWKPSAEAGAFPENGGGQVCSWVAIGLLLMGCVGLTLFAGPLTAYLDSTAEQIFDTRQYIEAVLGEAAILGGVR